MKRLLLLLLFFAPTIYAQNYVFNNESVRQIGGTGNAYYGETRIVAAAGSTTLGLLVKTAVGGGVNTAALADVGVFGVATSTQTAGASVEIARAGLTLCVADNSVSIADIIVVGSTTAGRCKDSGQTSSLTISDQLNVVGKAITAATVGNTFVLQVYGPGIYGVQTTAIPARYAILNCEGGLGDGLNVIPAGTYLQSTCYNGKGVTVTITGVKCYTDTGTSTLNAAGNTLGALLTGAVTCTSSFASGTQSANVALTSGDYIKFTFVADGTAKQTDWVVLGTY